MASTAGLQGGAVTEAASCSSAGEASSSSAPSPDAQIASHSVQPSSESVAATSAASASPSPAGTVRLRWIRPWPQADQVDRSARPVRPDRRAHLRPPGEQRGQVMARDGEGGRLDARLLQESKGSLHGTALGGDHEDPHGALGRAGQRRPVEAHVLRRERHVTLELERDHLGELAAIRARQLEGLHGDERARQAEPACASAGAGGHPARS